MAPSAPIAILRQSRRSRGWVQQSVQFRRAQLLMPTFVLPLMLLAVISSGTSAAQGLRGFPDVASYLAFVVPGVSSFTWP